MGDYKYLTHEQIVESGKYPFTMGQMRHLLLHRKENGLVVAAMKIGKRMVIRTDLFEKWMDQHKCVYK